MHAGDGERKKKVIAGTIGSDESRAEVFMFTDPRAGVSLYSSVQFALRLILVSRTDLWQLW